MADRRLAQRGPRELQCLAVDERAAAHADLHAHVQDRHHVGMNDEHVDGGTHDYPDGVQVGMRRVYLFGIEVSQQPTEPQRLQHSVQHRKNSCD